MCKLQGVVLCCSNPSHQSLGAQARSGHISPFSWWWRKKGCLYSSSLLPVWSFDCHVSKTCVESQKLLEQQSCWLKDIQYLNLKPCRDLLTQLTCWFYLWKSEVFKQSFWMRGFGSKTPKRTTLWSNSTGVRFFSTSKRARGKKTSLKLADVYYDVHGKKRYKGNSNLRSSQ